LTEGTIYVFLGSSSLDYYSETQTLALQKRVQSGPTLKDGATIYSCLIKLGLGKIPTQILFIQKFNLAKFGYILDTKVEKKKPESFYVLGYLLELIIKKCDRDLDLFLFKIWRNLFGLFFFHEKS
jgi:hypothetical protein